MTFRLDDRTEMERSTVLLCVLAAALGCTLDASNKHECRTNADCAAGRVCVVGTCGLATSRDGSSAVPNYVFVTSATVSGTIQSLDAADQICASAAAAGHRSGRFRAWLSTNTTSAIDRLETASGWIRTDGEPFAHSIADLRAGRILNPIFLDEYGARVSDRVITGTSVDGHSDPMHDCSDWTDGSGQAIAGTTDGTTGVWTYATTIQCDQSARLYCFGVDGSTTVPQQKLSGKLAFLSDAAFTVGGGVLAADAQCANEARTAGLPGIFRALIASTTATAMARLQANVSQGATWSRLDGVPLNRGGANAFFDMADMRAPLNVTSQMRYLDAIVFTGAAAPNVLGTASETCGDWVGGQTGSVGRASDMASWFANGTSAACTSVPSVEIYCFQAD